MTVQKITSAPTPNEMISTINAIIDDKLGKDILLDFCYPVGTLYWSKKSTDPGTLFGGTWTRVKDKFILAAGDSYAVGATGGEATHKLTVNEMPTHNHTASTNNTGAHYHQLGQDGGSGDKTWDSIDIFADKNNTAPEYKVETTTNGAHSHTVTVNNTGGNTAHNNMPPYVTYYCWERTA